MLRHNFTTTKVVKFIEKYYPCYRNYQHVVKNQLFERLTTCSMMMTVITPIAKPLPISGSMIWGAKPRGISWKSMAIISGRPMVSPSPNERTDCVECSISNDAASCVPIKKRSITPITGLGMAVSAQIMRSDSEQSMSSSVAGIRA